MNDILYISPKNNVREHIPKCLVIIVSELREQQSLSFLCGRKHSLSWCFPSNCRHQKSLLWSLLWECQLYFKGWMAGWIRSSLYSALQITPQHRQQPKKYRLRQWRNSRDVFCPLSFHENSLLNSISSKLYPTPIPIYREDLDTKEIKKNRIKDIFIRNCMRSITRVEIVF